MAKVTECPSGHRLQEWQARSGSCDGCYKFIRDGERVMDCRTCNYYLCDDCVNGRSTLWGALSSLIPSCTADTRGPMPASEVVVADYEPDVQAPVVDPRCNRRKAKDNGGPEAKAAPAPSYKSDAAKERPRSVSRGPAADTAAAKQQQRPRSTSRGPSPKQAAQAPLDLLSDAHGVPAAGRAAETGPPMDLLDAVPDSAPISALEFTAPADLGLLGAKGPEVQHDAMTAARMGAA